MLRENLDFIATLFFEAGITHWAVSPGSRNAPIVASFLRHGQFTLHSFPDERAAAFAALGMSLSNQYPAGVICTSGTAAINLYPAICEAYYQRTPLIVITADRPSDLIDQWDGQTIHQDHLFEPHCLDFFAIEGHSIDQISLQNTIYSAVETSLFPINGPVHINLSLEDPIYDGLNKPFFNTQPSKPFVFKHKTPEPVTAELILETIPESFSKILVIVGQHNPSQSLSEALSLLQHKIPVLTDICSHQIEYGIENWDLALSSNDFEETLIPEIIVTVGMATISKPLKSILRKYKPKHIHVCDAGAVGDPFQTKPMVLNHHDADFLTALYLHSQENLFFLDQWRKLGEKANLQKLTGHYLAEFELVQTMMTLPGEPPMLHFGNSMSIRYASWVGKSASPVYCNRGTSGIDGTLSTAVGFALANPDKQNICILGDISFLYDSNGMWTNHFPQNLKIMIINNGGGQIFNWINGPSEEPKLKPYIETPQSYQFADLCKFFQLSHIALNHPLSADKLREIINSNVQCIEFISK